MDSSLCSNLARKEATPLGDIPADILKHQALLANSMLTSMIVESGKERGRLGRAACGLRRRGVECLLTGRINSQLLYKVDVSTLLASQVWLARRL